MEVQNCQWPWSTNRHVNNKQCSRPKTAGEPDLWRHKAVSKLLNLRYMLHLSHSPPKTKEILADIQTCIVCIVTVKFDALTFSDYFGFAVDKQVGPTQKSGGSDNS